LIIIILSSQYIIWEIFIEKEKNCKKRV